MKPAISVKNLVKAYGAKIAVNNISFDVTAGSIFGFLGTNGAGKSTTINCIVTTLQASSGTITINGRQVGQHNDAIKKDLGVVFQSSLLDPLLTVRENLLTRGQFYDLKNSIEARIDELVKSVDLSDFIDQPYGKLSGGQKRRADIARALLHNPSILFLDEPTTGLDPKSRETIWALIHTLQKEQSKTIFLTTHYMEETENADMVAIINRGKLVSINTPQSLRAQYTQNILRVVAKDSGKLQALLRNQNIEAQLKDNGLFIIHPESSMAALTLLQQLKPHINDFEFRHGNMDDVFLELAENGAPS